MLFDDFIPTFLSSCFYSVTSKMKQWWLIGRWITVSSIEETKTILHVCPSFTFSTYQEWTDPLEMKLPAALPVLNK